MLARSAMGDKPEFYRVVSLHVSDDQVWDEQGVLASLSKATVKVELQGETRLAVAQGGKS